MESLKNLWSWVEDRWAERTTWDGVVVIALSVAVLLASPFAQYLAYAGIVYGAYRVYQEEM